MSQSPDTIVRSLSSRERVITALIDTLFPRCNSYNTTNDSEIISQFYTYKGSDFQGVALKVLQAIEKNAPIDGRKELHTLLWLLNTRFGTLLLAGRSSFTSLIPTAFPDLPLANREQVLLQWANSSNVKFRKAFVALKGLILPQIFTWLTPQGTSPLLEALKYNVTDPLRPLRPLPQALEAENTILTALVDLNGCDGSQAGIAHAAASLTCKGLAVHWPGHKGGLSSALWREKPAFVVEIDAIVVGSGAGGGVTAVRLAAAGLRVLVLEKSTFVASEHLSQKEGESFELMMECSGLISTESGGTAVLAGSTLGGGTRINWNASFKTPEHVRREWAEKYGLESFMTREYEAAMEAVWGRIGVRQGFQHGGACSALAAGLEASGIHCGEVPRNCADLTCSGHCCFGCARGAKQDTVNTFLADACNMGTHIVTGAYVEKIITQKSKKDSLVRASGRSKEALGVLVRVGLQNCCPLKIAFAAKIVVSCAGSIHTPALLLRSGITGNGTVGANLRLHPCTCVVGMFTENSPPIVPYLGETRGNAPGFNGGSAEKGFIRCSDGPIMSVFSREGAEWEGSGYGCVLYTPATHPGLFAFACPWYGGRSFKDLVLQYPNAVPVLVLVRDRGSGKIVIDKEGRPRLHYVVSEEDKVSMMKGMQMGLQAMVAGGAQGVMTLLNSEDGKFEFNAEDSSGLGGREALENVDFQRYLKRVQATGVPDLKLATFSAHQMGTACLGTNPETSALDPGGECWDVNGLFCCDGSTFPTSLGVNPMVTIESIAYFLAGKIGQEWQERQREMAPRGMNQSSKKGRKPVQLEYENNATAKL